MARNPRISFAVYPDQKPWLEEEARERGYHTAGNMARKVLFAFLRANRRGRHDKPRRDTAPDTESDFKKS